MKKETALLNGNVAKTYLSYLFPTIIGMLTNSVYCLVDVMFVGLYLGSDGLAAFNVAMPIFTFYSSLGLMLGVGGATVISVLIGEGRLEQVNSAFTFTVSLSAAIGLIATVGGTLFLKPLSLLLGATPELLPGVMEYLKPLQYIAIFYILNCTLQVIIRADYNPKLVMLAAVVGNLLNIFFDWLFVGKLSMGLGGASTATAIGPVTAVIILSFHYLLKKNTMWFSAKRIRLSMALRILKNGISTFILEFSAGMVIFLFNFVLLKVSGSNAVAAYAIVSNIAYVGKGLFNGISQAAQPLISVNYGAAQYARSKKAFSLSLFLAVGLAAVSFIIILIFPSQTVSFFVGDNPQLMPIAIDAIRLYFISFVFTGANTVIMYYLQSVENARAAVTIALLRGIVLIALALLIFPTLWGEAGVWLTITFAEGVTLIVGLILKRKINSRLVSRAI